MVQLVTTDVMRGKLWAGWEQDEGGTGEWDEMEADGCEYGEEGTLMVKAEVETPPKGLLQKIPILLSLENP